MNCSGPERRANIGTVIRGSRPRIRRTGVVIPTFHDAGIAPDAQKPGFIINSARGSGNHQAEPHTFRKLFPNP